MKATRHHEMDQGVNIAFGSGSGYSPGDKWHFKATSAMAARGPLAGSTDLVIQGSGFLEGPAMHCKLSDPRTMHTMTVPAQYISHEELRCTTELHPLDMITDPEPIGFGERTLYAHGTFRSIHSAVIDVRLNSSIYFQWRLRTMDSTRPLLDWSLPEYISPGSILPISEGVAIRFSSSESYFAGDEWSLSAYGNDSLSLAAYYQTVRDDSVRLDFFSRIFTCLHAEVMSMELVPFQCRIRRCSRPLTLPCRFRSMSSFKRPHVFSFSEEVSEAHFSRRALVQADSRLRANSSLTPNLVNFDSIVVHAGKYKGVGNSGMFVVRMQL